MYLSLFTVTELRYGINLLSESKRRAELERAYQATLQTYASRILTPNVQVAEAYAQLAAEQRQAGTPRPIFDLWLAATAKVTALTFVTRNVKDFKGLGVGLENPFET